MACKARIDRRWLVALVLTSAPLLSGGWVFSYPIDNERVHTTATGTGTADPSVTVKYEIWLPGGTLDKGVTGTSNAGGGWYLTIAGPLQVGTGRTAYLKDGGGNIKDTSTNITVSNTP